MVLEVGVVEGTNADDGKRSSAPRFALRVVAALLIVAALGVAVFAARSYLLERDYYRIVYTRLIEFQDIVDTARNALAALEEAEIHGQNYVLTGESAYSKAWVEDSRAWQDETATLALMAEHDKALPFVKDLTSTGDRVLKELSAVVALYDGGSRDKALDSVRKGPGVGDLERARDLTAKVVLAGRIEASGASRAITNGIRRRRLAASVAALLGLTLIGAVLLIFETRRGAKLRSTNPAGSLPDRA
jgi:CHASE3 domain sensor protein